MVFQRVVGETFLELLVPLLDVVVNVVLDLLEASHLVAGKLLNHFRLLHPQQSSADNPDNQQNRSRYASGKAQNGAVHVLVDRSILDLLLLADSHDVSVRVVQKCPDDENREKHNQGRRQNPLPYGSKRIVTGALLVAFNLLINYLAQRLTVLAKLVKHILNSAVYFHSNILAQLSDLVGHLLVCLLVSPIWQEHGMKLEGMSRAHSTLQLLDDLRHNVGAVDLVPSSVELGEVVRHLGGMVDRQLLNDVHAAADKSLADRIKEYHDHGRMLGQLVDH
mmetsp:Transcript_19555/g.44734  ORF Transcript_19555/g.44734 Transcript_19555/m.44734 type:complete len:278 (+) Transcript_19555:129-962(+)